MRRPIHTQDLSSSERHFVDAMNSLGFGRFESLRIECGELILSPWPTTVRTVKFGLDPATLRSAPNEFTLKAQAAEFFEYVRGVDTGEIRCLEVRHGLPFGMEIERRINAKVGCRV